jgi:hypothetical protein
VESLPKQTVPAPASPRLPGPINKKPSTLDDFDLEVRRSPRIARLSSSEFLTTRSDEDGNNPFNQFPTGNDLRKSVLSPKLYNFQEKSKQAITQIISPLNLSKTKVEKVTDRSLSTENVPPTTPPLGSFLERLSNAVAPAADFGSPRRQERMVRCFHCNLLYWEDLVI